MEEVKPDKKDKSERLNYLHGEKSKQEKRRSFYFEQLQEIKRLLDENEKEIIYNEGWVSFHENSILEHQKIIDGTFDFNERIDQEEKLKFHVKQIEEHHRKNIDYHKKEISAIKKEVELFEEGIKRCEEQLEFLHRKIKENSE